MILKYAKDGCEFGGKESLLVGKRGGGYLSRLAYVNILSSWERISVKRMYVLHIVGHQTPRRPRRGVGPIGRTREKKGTTS